MNAIQQLEQLGQSIWFDNISRRLIRSGELKKRIDEGLLGMTSNPTIFDEAISGSRDYDDQIKYLLEQIPAVSVQEIIRAVMAKDVQDAADLLRPVFDRTHHRDGYVSIEVDPLKARDTAATIVEVRELWSLIHRPNLMVKIPATREGLPAIEQMTAEGVNVNITLIFSRKRYEEVAEAYLAGLDRRVQAKKSIEGIRSVASVFVSRIDTLVDGLLTKKMETAQGDGQSRLAALRGKVAVANTKEIYQSFRKIFSTPRFDGLKKQGAAIQRPLWGSTGTKNPSYSDLKYVEELIGADTVNTVPPKTYAAILARLRPEPTIERDLSGARAVLRSLEETGISLDAVTQQLENEGVEKFAKSFRDLTKTVEEKQAEIVQQEN